MSTTPQPTHVLGLDLVRLACALLVACFHLLFWYSAAGTDYGQSYPSSLNFQLFAPAWAGVEVFFVLSGYVIASAAQQASAQSFALNRFLRLYPAIWLCTALTVLATAALPHAPGLGDIARSVAIFPKGEWVSPVYWTLPVEITFYLLVGGLLAIGRGDRLESLGAALGLYSAAFWGASLLVPQLEPFTYRYYAALLMLRHGCFFGLGVMIWATAHRGATVRRLLLFGLFTAAALVEIAFAGVHKGEAAGIDFGIAPAGVFALMLAAIIGSVALRRLTAPPAVARAFRTAGLMTYPLYLLHGGVGSLVVALPFATPGVRVAAALAASLAAAYLVVKAEPHLRRAVRGLLTRSPTAPAAAE